MASGSAPASNSTHTHCSPGAAHKHKPSSSQPVQTPGKGRGGVLQSSRWGWGLRSAVQSLNGPSLTPSGEHNQVLLGTEVLAVTLVPPQLDGSIPGLPVCAMSWCLVLFFFQDQTCATRHPQLSLLIFKPSWL